MSNEKIKAIDHNDDNDNDNTDNCQQKKIWINCFKDPDILKYIVSFLSNDGEKYSLD